MALACCGAGLDLGGTREKRASNFVADTVAALFADPYARSFFDAILLAGQHTTRVAVAPLSTSVWLCSAMDLAAALQPQ